MEDERFLSEQIITYIGNKRKLLPFIEEIIKNIKEEKKVEKLICADLFSGSGIVARMLKQHSSIVITNDLEDYSKVINDCYLTNKSNFDENLWDFYKKGLDEYCKELKRGIISENYAPKNDKDIKRGERVFFTTRNAMYIDTALDFILSKIPEEYQKFFMAPLLYEVSVHANTSGVFKGFYKNKEGIGQYGGTAGNCLDRLKGDIEIKKPVLSNYSAQHISLQGDTNKVVKSLARVDVAYLDPPYNQHPFGSNYFMLNTVLHNKVGPNLSTVSGIPDNWNRSEYNKKAKVLEAVEDAIKNLRTSYIVVSYNNEGFIHKEDMETTLKKYGSMSVQTIKYNTFRGSRNLADRKKYVDEYLFILKKV